MIAAHALAKSNIAPTAIAPQPALPRLMSLPRLPSSHPVRLLPQLDMMRKLPLPVSSVMPMSGDVMVHCTRDSKCVKENGHRGRCSLQRRPCEEEMVAMLHQIRSLQVEITEVKRERDRLQTEVSNLWSKLAKACAFLADIVRSKRSANLRSHTSPSADEYHRELKKITLGVLQVEANGKHEQLRASLTLLESSMLGLQEPQECARRQSEIDTYKRQFDEDMQQLRMSHNAAAERNASEIVPYIVVSQTMMATEKMLSSRVQL